MFKFIEHKRFSKKGFKYAYSNVDPPTNAGNSYSLCKKVMNDFKKSIK